ncbi:unnamed protein product [Prorocentrum cordatum]|uniref:Uncharacterized protein n=1 Tax=Prorocentrum cordatum TaxID=2364126 RepID=A0ABN9UDW6_9DINO|nr:unnamed protein product [Polarella glacialis]
MTKAALLLLATAPLLSVGASAPHRRFAWGRKVQRRLSGDDGPPITDECLVACPGLSDMVAAQGAFEEPTPLDWTNLYCDHESAVQCFVDELATCSSSEVADDFVMMASMLKCICDTCPGGKTAWANLLAAGDDDSDSSGSGMVGTTTLADGTDTTGASDDTDSMCLVYPFVSCAEDYETDCGAILENMNISISGDVATQLESACAGDDDDLPDMVGSCGPFGLGWIAASLAPVMAALEFAAA